MMSNPYAAPRVSEPGEGGSTDARTRLAVLALATFAGPLLGYIVGDLIVSPHPETRSPGVFLTALMLAPLSVPLQGGALGLLLASLLPIHAGRALGGLIVVGGLSFWPVYLWLSWRWIRFGGSGMTVAAIVIWLFLGYFKIAERFEIMMGV